MEGTMKVSELLEQTPIQQVIDEEGRTVSGTTRIDTRGWVRPEWSEKTLIIRVRKTGDDTVEVVNHKKMDQH